ncbi:MAG: hemolysin III family protein [Actinomycetota bacterium]
MPSSASVPVAERPLLRGWSHVGAFLVAIPAGVVLVVQADHAMARVAAGIYALTVLVGFGTSAAYHRLARSPRAGAIMQRLDHSAIYLLIAGTYVPACLVALPPRWGVPLLCFVGAGAVTGVVLKLAAFHRVRWLSDGLYPVLGWAAVAVFPVLVDSVSTTVLVLLFAGGVAYTVGFPVLLAKRPDPWPRVFGYHEVWHAFTVVAAVLHFAAVASVVT